MNLIKFLKGKNHQGLEQPIHDSPSQEDIMDLIVEREADADEDFPSTKLLAEEDVAVTSQSIDISTIENYNSLKSRIIDSLEHLTEVSRSLSLNGEGFIEQCKKIKESSFNIVVLGEFSRGKSTFINCLLGNKVLPTDILPTTAVLTMVHHDDKARVELHYKDTSIREISPEKLSSFITGVNESSAEQAQQIKYADIYFPNDFCKNSCVIIDTPGVNDINEQNVEITYNYIPRADAAIMILDPDQPFTQSEKDFIEKKIIDKDISKIFFILNKFDQVKEENKENVLEYVKTKILSLHGINSSSIKLYPISSKKALVAKIKGQTDSYVEQFREFESALQWFLVNEKGKYILLNPIKRAMNLISELESNIDIINQNLNTPLIELKKKYAEFIDLKVKIELRRDEITKLINSKYLRFKKDLNNAIESQLSEIFSNIENEIKTIHVTKEEASNVIPQIIEERLHNWIENQVYPFIYSSLSNINDEVTNALAEVNKEFNDFKSTALCVRIENNESLVHYVNQNNTINNDYDFINGMMDIAQSFGVGVLIAALIGGPFSTLLGIFGGGMVFNFIEKRRMKKDINIIVTKLSEGRNEIIYKVQKEMAAIIDNNYSMNESTLINTINGLIANNQAMIDKLIRDKEDKKNEVEKLRNDLNNSLIDVYKVKKTFVDIFKQLEGDLC